MTLNEAIVNTIVGTLIGLGGVLIGVMLTNRHTTKVAKASGAFRSARMRVRCLGVDLLSERGRDWCFLIPGTDNDSAVIPMEIHLINFGDAPCEGLVLTILISRYCIPDNDEGLTFEVIPGVEEAETKKATVTLDGFRQLSLKLPLIRPRSAAAVTYPIRLIPTVDRPGSTDATTADHVKIRVGWRTTIAFPITITVLLRESPSLHYSWSIFAVTADNINDARQRYFSSLNAGVQSWMKSKSRFHLARVAILGPKVRRSVRFIRLKTESSADIKGERIHMMAGSSAGTPEMWLTEVVVPREAVNE
jgi:hypothetical protein